MKKNYDLIVIGSGSVGVPVALEFAKMGQSVLVIDSLPSPGQGQDKKAIGGIRATHSDKGKIAVCQGSIGIFSHWKETRSFWIGVALGCCLLAEGEWDSILVT